MNQQNMKTSNIVLATTLTYFGHPVVRIVNESQRGIFYFEDTEGLEQCLTSFWAGVLTVEPQAFYNQVKSLKARASETL